MKFARAAVLILAVLLIAAKVFAYSVLTHEEIVDLLWTSNILPLIEQRYPGLTDEQIKQAHAYAYGGSVIQDLGYYPFGSKEFSDLVHYVRTGDFVSELVKQSQDANEFAFALGAMAHYVADVDGHPAVNQAVALRYPKLRSRYGRFVTYEEDKVAHLKTEFGFDVSQVAKHRYAPEDYHNFIGFEVSEGLLERAFPAVYGLELKDVLAHEDLTVGTYRWAISQLIPKMTKVALALHGKEMVNETPNFEKRKFLYRLRRADYEKAWGTKYQKPGCGTRFLTALLRLVPKIGPFKGLNFNEPTKQTEDLYIASINKTFEDCRTLLEKMRTTPPELPDRDLDTGAPTLPAEYALADRAYGQLVTQLADKKFAETSKALRDNILTFYASATPPLKATRDEAVSEKLTAALVQLKAVQPGKLTVQKPSE